jgi:hypothetical protein
MKTKQELEQQLKELDEFEGLYEKFILPMASEGLRLGSILTLKWILGHKNYNGSGMSPAQVLKDDLKKSK